MRAKGGVTNEANRPYRAYAGYGCNTATPRIPGTKTAVSKE